MGRASKDKRDIFYRLAKEEGWRARSAYKLLQINQTFNIFENVTKAVDLCAAPGSWSQVLSQTLPKSAETHIVAVDLQTMAPIPGVVCLKGDITRESTATQIISHLGNSKAQLVCCDGAPDVIGFHQLDEYFQSQLVLAALNIALAVLEPNGTFIAKFFRASPQGVRSTYLRFKVFFQDVVLTKPRSSRASSIECFIVARKFQLPEAYAPGAYNPFNKHNELIDQGILKEVQKLPQDVKLEPKAAPRISESKTKSDILQSAEMAALSLRESSTEDTEGVNNLAATTRPNLDSPSSITGAGSVPTDKLSMTLQEFMQLHAVDQEVEDAIWLEHLKDDPAMLGKNELPSATWPPNFRKPVEFRVKWNSTAPQFKASSLYVPCVTSGDLNGFDSDTTYSTPKGYVSLPPVQGPITPAYAEAVARRKLNIEKGTKREKFGAKFFTGDNTATFPMLKSQQIQLSFGGGAEKLVGNIKSQTAKVTIDASKKLTLTVLMDWIKNNLVVERPELLFLDGDVRPGILVLVNDMDYELLEDGINHELSSLDKVSFISTLHGG